MKFKLLVVILLFSVSQIMATNIYVSNTGNNNYPGNQFQPLLHIQKAADIAKPGDTVIVLNGIYTEKIVIRNKKGTAEEPIVFRATGEVIINFQGDIQLNQPDLKTPHSEIPLSSGNHPYHPYYLGAIVRIENSGYIFFDGFKVLNSQWFGIAAYECNNLNIQNCYVDNTQASGIYILDSKNITLKNNEVSRACTYPLRIPGDKNHGTQEFISVVNCNGFEVSYNRVHESGARDPWGAAGTGEGGEGIDVKEASMNGSIHHNLCWNLSRLGIYCDAWNAKNYHNVKVFNNIVHNCGAGIAIAGEDGGNVRDVYIYNNLIYNNRYSGINLAYWGHNGSKKDIYIFNNTIFKNRANGIDIASEIHEDIQIINNILYQNGKDKTDNLIIGPARNVQSENNLVGTDPMFINWRTGDFRLKEKSPAIDAGIDTKFKYNDLNEQPRVSGAKIDIGAYEFQ